MAVTNNITLFSDTATEYFNATELAEPTNTTHTGAVLNNRLNYKSYNSFAKTVSTICAGLAEFLATYGGIASGTMDVDTDLMTWTNYMQALTTDNKMANAQNAVTPLAISGTTTNTKSTTGHTHSLATGTIASGNQNPITGNTAYTYVNPYFTNTSNIKNSGGGFSAGLNATATSGGAIGNGVTATSGGAIGNGATATSGGAIGNGATATSGGAIGLNANGGYGGAVGESSTATSGGAVGYASNAQNGGAVGNSAQATNGFAGGNNAKATANNAVQLGTGTNNTANTMQFLDKQVLATNFSKLTPSTANGWTQANQDTTLNVEDGLYLVYITTSTFISSIELVPIYSNNFLKGFELYETNTPARLYFARFKSTDGNTNLKYFSITIPSESSIHVSTIQSFTYYYKKLV